MNSRAACGLALLGAAFGGAGCSTGTPSVTATAPIPACRRYATDLDENGLRVTCAFTRNALLCRGGTHSSWFYRSLDDFVGETQAPNRILAESAKSTGVNAMPSAYAETIVDYEYDRAQRVLVRRRRWIDSPRFAALDETHYTLWDHRGRPLRGRILAGGASQPVAIAYDDARGTAASSNGEVVIRDGDGNRVLEIEVFGLGSASFSRVRRYDVIATAEVCR